MWCNPGSISPTSCCFVGPKALRSLLATAWGPAVQGWTEGFGRLCGWQIIPDLFYLVQIMDQGLSLVFCSFLLAEAGAAVHSSLWSGESPG